MKASDLAAGEYSGTVEIAGSANAAVARVPYWYASPGSSPVAYAGKRRL